MGRIVAYEACPRCRENYRDTRGDNLAVYDDGGKHCFACKYHEFPKHYIPRKEVDSVPKSLRPADYTREVPASALKWLLQYGLPWSYWKDSLGYSPKESRLVFSVGQPLAFSIGRYVGNEATAANRSAPLQSEGRVVVHGIKADKSSNYNQGDPSRTREESGKPVRKWFVWGDCHKHTEAIVPRGGSEYGIGEYIILVEDLISAHKIGQVTTSIPLFGTKIHPCHYYYLINSDKPVVLWLDKDQELNVKKQAWQLESVINRPVKVVITEQDPKKISYEEIKNILRST